MGLMSWVRVQWDRAAALAAMAIGLLAFLIGWIGVSGTSYVAKQLPYVVSGALFGIFMVGVAAVLWLSADLRDEWRELRGIRTALDAQAGGTHARPATQIPEPAVQATEQGIPYPEPAEMYVPPLAAYTEQVVQYPEPVPTYVAPVAAYVAPVPYAPAAAPFEAGVHHTMELPTLAGADSGAFDTPDSIGAPSGTI